MICFVFVRLDMWEEGRGFFWVGSGGYRNDGLCLGGFSLLIVRATPLILL